MSYLKEREICARWEFERKKKKKRERKKRKKR
eukprot:CAMPEP_0201479116 /NCGR_PEP_ID=MMETSP0151_2-20130828/3848_1 /ASSEMBLY_ACC=CAM_ASM_000257 /TAXON_ID=200890 /ORGANISM="Paramoeba atlantica, Strain 621/1 / CCAP 1560/9" /LENGTH=31 /DNA_ID= /DNA_START= /DNA_END= /DNA_ORIENTATION=